MVILGIETSCDETAVAVIDIQGLAKAPRVKILSNVVASQAKLHAKFGGVVPNLAKREHQRNLVSVLLMALKEAKLRNSKLQIPNPKQIPNSKFKTLNSILEREKELLTQVIKQMLPLRPPAIDVIAVTVGPGLAPALWVGVNFARALGYLWGKPLIPVNHLEGHIYTNLIPQIHEVKSQKSKAKSSPRPITYHLSPITFPALCLIVSGGHTELVLIRGYGQYRVIGETRDDAAGEAFDKVAKMMGLGFPGGPIISRLAERGNPRAFNFPRPMLNTKDYDFSFSGLKTAVLYTLRDPASSGITAKQRNDVSASFEQAVVDVLAKKTVRAARQYRAKTVMIGGGVAANRSLRSQLGEALKQALPNTYYLTPNTSLTGDNALMIALAGYFNRKKKSAWGSVQADANLRLDATSG
ncbi:MAG: tRNA (adenosine(37)-N6)-threonylcarbamoyltransferase complex transferase subunit TsaD [Candidatus Sungbacteria bacterium]|uniref:tRNA N6-adenosine threonylcarbamoyltransferase n=1 Tax=Candidatus Sungiibacteriota bacterium TaxID=2750080 RepID=A0A932YZE3_9BACT|nr:tRNA (adenosine(37)-N6)-threonylcarbamoyltransferase complex transferase subunit TsaD [Candidatus Sungbacteria bacterium]